MMKRGNNPNEISDIDALHDYIAKLKDMNIVKVKEMLTNHVNLASYINTTMKKLDYIHCYGLE